VADYERQWQKACERIIAGEEKSALIVSHVSPPASEFLVWWPLYRDGEIVHVRNELLFYAMMNVPFSVQEPWNSIRDRRATNDEGLEISEWDTNLESLRQFVDEKRSTKS
jgi:CdiI N-terminal domain